MRIRTGHKPDDWTENVPSAAWLAGVSGVRGGQVVEEPERKKPPKNKTLTVSVAVVIHPATVSIKAAVDPDRPR